ncbi:MAG: hypothetical protein ACR2LI_09595 [Propionibacteriaceae bacterium]
MHLDAVGADHGVRAFSLHPGGILTPLQRHLPKEEQIAMGWIDENGVANPDIGFKTPGQGAATQVWAATSPQLAGMGGVFCEDVEVARVSTGDEPGVRPYAVDPDEASRLWALSAQLTGVDALAR